MNPEEEKRDTDRIVIRADLKVPGAGKWDSYCCRLVNAGTAEILMNAEFQRQLIESRDRIGIRYVRFWDIYSPDLYLDIHAEEENQNFSKIDEILDFLIRDKMKPYIELGNKPVRILRNTGRAIREELRENVFSSDEERKQFFQGMIRHLIRRYGAEEVSTWYFEYWEDNTIRLLKGDDFSYNDTQKLVHKEYLHCFNVIAGALRVVLPDIKIGGAGFSVRFYGVDEFTHMLKMWAGEEQKPDFLSLSCYPYNLERENGDFYEKRSADMKFVLTQIDMARKAMARSGFENYPLHVTEYSSSLSNRNVLNDSLIKGAFLVQNAIVCFGKAELMGHWLFSDVYSSEIDTESPLFGGCGLITRNGISKPSFFALDFMNRLYDQVVESSDHHIVTRNKSGSVRIVCHNIKKLNYRYYLDPEDELEPSALPSIMENRERLIIHIRLENMVDGIYDVRSNKVNADQGGVQERWMDLNMEKNLSMHELDYLKQICVPSMKIRTEEVSEGVLEFDMEMEPNEIRYIYISLK